MDKPPFPAYLDNSAISDYKRCPTLWQYGSLHKLTRPGKSVHLHAGGCFATGLEATRRGFHEFGLSEDEAIILGMHAVVLSYGDFEPEGRDEVKSCERVVFGLIEYFIQYGLAEDQLHPFQFDANGFGIEFNFALPLPIENPSTGEPLLYTGRFDQLATYNGTLYGEDDKTAMQLGPTWAKQWELDSQFTGYCLLPGTEVLTPTGWVPIEQVTNLTRVMQWDQGQLSFVLPTALHAPKHEGALYELKGKTHSISTGEHRQLVFDTYSRKYKTYTTATLPMTSGALRLISAGIKEEGLPLPLDFIRLLVAFQADGSWKGGTSLSFHFTKKRKADRLEGILRALNIPFSKHNTEGYSYRISKGEEVGRLIHQYLGPEKLFDSWLLSLSGETLRAFIIELQFWDGTSRGSRGWMYFTTVEQNAQWVQTIAALTGHYSSRHEQRTCETNKWCFRINITENCQHAVHLHQKTAFQYEGKVYCITVPSSYFLIRSKGKISVTGNSWAAREYGYSLAGFFVRGLSFLTKGYGHAQTIVYRADWQIDRWLESTLDIIHRMIEDYTHNHFIAVLDKSVCASYSGCKFHSLCASQFPSRWMAQYEHNPWNPMERESLDHSTLIATLFPKA